MYYTKFSNFQILQLPFLFFFFFLKWWEDIIYGSLHVAPLASIDFLHVRAWIQQPEILFGWIRRRDLEFCIRIGVSTCHRLNLTSMVFHRVTGFNIRTKSRFDGASGHHLQNKKWAGQRPPEKSPLRPPQWQRGGVGIFCRLGQGRQRRDHSSYSKAVERISSNSLRDLAVQEYLYISLNNLGGTHPGPHTHTPLWPS